MIRIRRAITLAALAMGALGLLAAPAAAQQATVCVKAKVVVNGQELVNVDQCQTVPPPAP